MKPSRSFGRTVEHHYHAPVMQVYTCRRNRYGQCDSFDRPKRMRTIGTQTDPMAPPPPPPDPKTWKGWATLQARKLRPIFDWLCVAFIFIVNRINFGIPIRIGGYNRD